MKPTTIKFTKETFELLKGFLLQSENEQHAFLFCNISENKDKIVFLPKEIVIFDDENISNSTVHFKADKKDLHQVFLQFVNTDYQALISCHSHPFEKNNVWFSNTDDRNDNNLMSYFYSEITSKKENAHMLALVFGQETIGARGYDQENSIFTDVQKIVVMDEPIKYIIPANNSTENNFFLNSELFNRQILAFGEEGQRILSGLQVSLIGAGGTGSILAEGLIRLGIRDLIIIDDDKLELTNLNRWQGGQEKDVGEYKVDILKNNLSKMFNEDIDIKIFRDNIFNKDVIDSIKNSDVLIGAVDNHKTRYFTNKLSLQYLIPFLDCANGIISNEDNTVNKIGIRNSVVIPSITSCLDCVEGRFYNKSDFRYDFASPETRKELKDHNYIKTTESIPSPSVYPMNMMSVSILLLEFMNLFMGYKPVYWNTYFNYLDFEKEASFSKDTANQTEQPNINCFQCNDFIALGDSDDILKVFNRKNYGTEKNKF